MLTIYDTKKHTPVEPSTDGEVILPTHYTLLCKDAGDNKIEINTDKETWLQVTNFLDLLKQV